MASILRQGSETTTHHNSSAIPPRDLFFPLRQRLNGFEIRDRQLAHFLCQFIPRKCFFERDVTLFGKTYHIPPLCRINPLFDEVMAIRFRALAYLTDICGEDVTPYIC